MEPAFIQLIWPLYVGVLASQLRNKGSCEYGCSPASYQVVAGDPVNTKSGNLTLDATDMTIPVLGEPLTWSRTYNSHALAEPSLFGPGWSHPYALRLILPSDPDGIAGQVTVVGPSGNQYTFRITGTSYQPLAGIYARLSRDATGYTLTLPSNASRRFDLTGRFVSQTDAQGHTLTLSYYTTGIHTGFLQRIADSTNQRFLTLTYMGTTSLDRRIASVTDPLGRVVQYQYAADGILSQVRDPMNRPTVYTTDRGLLTTVTVNGERQLTNEYEKRTASAPVIPNVTTFAAYRMADWPPVEFKRVLTQTNGLNVQTVYTYNTDHTLVTTNDGTNLFTEKHTYRADGSLDRIDHQSTTGWTTTERAQFNSQTLGRVQTTDRYSSTLRQASNGLGQTTALTDALNGSVSMTYNPPTHATAPNQLATMRDALGRETRYTYGPGGVITSMTTGMSTQFPQGRTTTYTYDVLYPGKHWLEAVTDPLGATTSYRYNSWGQQTQVMNALGQTTTMTYDAVGRLSAVTNPAGRITRYSYNPDDTLASVTENCTDSNGTPLLAGGCAAQTSDRNVTTSYDYDAQARQIWVKDPLGRYTATRYGADNRVQWTVKNLVASGFPATLPTQPPSYTPALPDQNVATFYQYDGLGRTTLITETGFLTGTLQASVDYRWVFDQTYQRVTKTIYDVFGRPVKVIHNYRADVNSGNQSTSRPDVNVTTTYFYSDAPHYDTVCDPLNRCTRTEYDALGRVKRVIERYQDGSAGPGDQDVITTTGYRPDGNVDFTIRNYGDGNYDEATDRSADLKTSYGYDDWGRLTQTTTNVDLTPTAGATDVNLVSRSLYDANDRVYATQDPFGRVQRTTYDRLGRVIETVQNCTGATATQVNGSCDPVSDVQPDRNIRTWTSYTVLGQTDAVTETLSASQRRVSVTQYDGMNRPTVTINNCTRSGQPASANCDTPNPDNTTQSDTNRRTSMTYDANGNLLVQTNPRGFYTSFSYDGLNRLDFRQTIHDYFHLKVWQQTDGHGVVQWHEGDNADITVLRTDGIGRTIATIAGYANGQHMASDRSDDDVISQTRYDLGGRVTDQINPDGQRTHMDYGLTNQPSTVTENVAGSVAPANIATSATYNRLGQRLTLTDARNTVRRWSYSSLGQLLTFTDGVNRQTTWTYDVAGRMQTRTDARGSGSALTYGYNLRDQQTSLTAPGLSVPITMQYDAQGRRTSMTDATGTTTWSYDRADRVNGATQPNAGNLVYGYDAGDNRTVLTYPTGGPALTYGYFKSNMLKSISQSGVVQVDYWSVEAQQIWFMTWQTPQLRQQFNVDRVGRIDQVSIAHPDVAIPFRPSPDTYRAQRPTVAPSDRLSLNILYTLSSAGRHEQIDEYVQSADPPVITPPAGSFHAYLPMVVVSDNPLYANTTWSLSYDGLNRLTNAALDPIVFTPARPQAPSSPTNLVQEGATYDATSNRTSRTLNGTTQSGFQYDAADQRTGWTYDAVGNVLNDGTSTYTYDPLNRLISVTRAGVTTTYSYNGDGLMVAKTVNGGTTRFLWDTTKSNAQLLGTTTNSATTWYVWGQGGNERDQILYETSASGRKWYGTDALGSVRQTYDDAGNVLSKRTWTPFGIEQGTYQGNTIGYAGEWQDSTGLIYLRARWYDPQQGRFLSRDPWDGDLTSPQTLNPYAYAHNQPTRYTDPSGRCAEPVTFILCSMALGAAVGAGSNLIMQVLDDRPGINWWEVGGSAATGALLGIPVVGTSVAIVMTLHAANEFRKAPTFENGLMLTLNMAGAFCGLRGLGGMSGGGSGMAPALAGGGTTMTAQTVTRAVLADTVASTSVTASQTSGLVHMVNSGDEGQAPSGVARPGYRGPSNGYYNKRPFDFRRLQEEKLEDVLSSGSYVDEINNTTNRGHPKSAQYLYVIDKDGNIRVTPNIKKARLDHHADLVDKGETVYGAGIVWINKVGRVSMVDDTSGHYMPNGKDFYEYMEYILNNKGIETKGILFVGR